MKKLENKNVERLDSRLGTPGHRAFILRNCFNGCLMDFVDGNFKEYFKEIEYYKTKYGDELTINEENDEIIFEDVLNKVYSWNRYEELEGHKVTSIKENSGYEYFGVQYDLEHVNWTEYTGPFSSIRCLADLLQNVKNLGGVVGLIYRFDKMEVNEKNRKTTLEEFKKIRKVLQKALSYEQNSVIEKFQNGKISKLQFDAYLRNYDAAKEKLPTLAENWEQRQKKYEEKQQAKQRKAEAILKRKEEKEQRRVARLAKREELKKLKAQRQQELKAKKEQDAEQKRKDYIAKLLNKNEEETR